MSGQSVTKPVKPAPADRDEHGRPYLRTIARVLQKHLQQNPESSVEWISVHGEGGLDAPGRVWTYDGATALDECLLQVSLAQGYSEGMLIYVHAQPDRYMPGSLSTLMTLKLLCSPERAAQEIAPIWRWFNSKEFHDLLAAPAHIAGV